MQQQTLLYAFDYEHTQVKNRDRCVTLDIKNGERAVLLKNHAGDWGLVLGCWTGMRKPVPGK